MHHIHIITGIQTGMYILCGAVIAAAIGWLTDASYRRRRRIFRQREQTDFDTWFARHYGAAGVSRDVAFGVTHALAEEIDCHETQILPDDSIAGALRLTPAFDDSFEVADLVLEDLLADLGIPWPLDNQNWSTVDDVIRSVDAATRVRRESHVGQASA